jgi:D-aminopeptidase
MNLRFHFWTVLVCVVAQSTALAAADKTLEIGAPAEVELSAEKLRDGVKLFEQAVERDELRGAVLLVARRGKIVLHEALGWRHKEDKQPMQKDTLFRMASNTKPVIATAVLMLAEQGKLGLADPVRKHIPSWDNYKSGFIKVDQLLSHTSGLRIPVIFFKPLAGPTAEFPDNPSLRAEVDRLGAIGAEEIPGTTYQYNNPGFNTLGRLIEVGGGMPLEQYLKEKIYDPLGMTESWNHESRVPHERMCRVHQRKNNEWTVTWSPGDAPDWPFVRGSGGMISTARDYAVFCQMYLNRGIYNGKRLLKEESVANATANHTQSVYTPEQRAARSAYYGLGWMVGNDGSFSHGGSDGTHAWVDPRRELIVLTFTQSPGGRNPRDAFQRIVCDACLDLQKEASMNARPRLRDLEISIGVLPTGENNAITDVAGVQVGHVTLHEGDSVRTGVTTVVPHTGNIFQEKVPAAVHVANGFGKFVGSTQIDELGVMETPLVLTNTLSTFAAADALAAWTLKQPGNEAILSVNPVVGECNDGFLNDIRSRRVTAAHVEQALRDATSGPVAEGCVGAGTGTRCLGWKGGIGTSSRKLPANLGGYTVGVLVQTNFGGQLTIAGVPVGRELGTYYLKDELKNQEHGSCIVVVATAAPLDARRLKRLAARAPLGLAAAGSPITHGSGDYVLAFSTHPAVHTSFAASRTTEKPELLRDDALSPLFQAVRDATEEAVVNSLLKATTTQGHLGHIVEAIDPDEVARLCKKP